MRLGNVSPRRDLDGFSLVEVMVAALVLMIGVLGTFTLLDGANRTLRENNAHVAATNLGREIIEQTRSIDYDLVTNAGLVSQVRPRINPGAASSAGGAWQVERSSIVFTVTTSVCTFDDPKDGLMDSATPAAQQPPNMCPRPAAINTDKDTNPDDFRRVEVVVAWKRGTLQRRGSQTALIVNPSGSLGPRITQLVRLSQMSTPTTAQVSDSFYHGTSGTSCPSTDAGCPVVKFRASSLAAKTLHWYADDIYGYTKALQVQSGSACCADGLNWTLDWPIGTLGTQPFVVDGAYTLTAQAFNSVGVAGEAAVVPVLLNRRPPPALTNVTAGRNARFGVVDLLWSRSPDKDIQEYRVYRITGSGSSATKTLICPLAGAPLATSCTDTSPPSGSVSYELRAVDRTDLADSTSQLRESLDPVTRTLGATTLTQPPSPANLAVATDNGVPRLTWSQPAVASGAPAIAFYRIYRDGVAIANRYDRTATIDPFYGDSAPGAALSRTYTVTAVDSTMNESEIAARSSDGERLPVTWTRP